MEKVLRHPYHLVDPSPWPLLISLSALTLAVGVAQALGGHGGNTILIALPAVLLVAFGWWRDVLREGGDHTRLVRRGLTLGFLLFLLSEVMLFFSFLILYLLQNSLRYTNAFKQVVLLF